MSDNSNCSPLSPATAPTTSAEGRGVRVRLENLGTASSLALLTVLLLLSAGCRSAGKVDDQESLQDVAQEDEFGEFDDFEEFEVEAAEPVYDPLGGYNRAMFAFNDGFLLWVWNPVVKGYAYVAPQPARVATKRFFDNLFTPVRFGNSLLQLKVEKSGTELGRFLVNSTLGLAGLFDPAEAWFGWGAPSPEDFGQTLASYGVGSGFPLVLPFLGPSNLRDGVSLVPNAYMNPAYYFTSALEGVAITAFERSNQLSLHLGEYESLKQDALDPYTLFRDAYQQYRENLIKE